MRGVGKKGDRKLYFVATPLFMFFMLLYIFPIIMTIWYSFLDNSFSMMFIGFENFFSVGANPYFVLAVRNTIELTGVLVSCALLCTIMLGYLLKRHHHLSKYVSLILLLPMLIPSAAVAPVWQVLFHVSAFSSSMRSYMSLASLFVWKYSGASAMLLYVMLSRIPKEIDDAAKIDGAGNVRIYMQMSLPVLKKEMGFVVLLLIMYAFRIYKESYLLFGEYPPEAMYLVQHYLYNHFMKMNFQYVAAGAVIFGLFAFCAYALVIFWMKYKGR